MFLYFCKYWLGFGHITCHMCTWLGLRLVLDRPWLVTWDRMTGLQPWSVSKSAGFEYYEASAKENINVRQVFERLVDIICIKMSERVDTDPAMVTGAKTTKLTDKPTQLPQNCACWSRPLALSLQRFTLPPWHHSSPPIFHQPVYC